MRFYQKKLIFSFLISAFFLGGSFFVFNKAEAIAPPPPPDPPGYRDAINSARRAIQRVVPDVVFRLLENKNDVYHVEIFEGLTLTSRFRKVTRDLYNQIADGVFPGKSATDVMNDLKINIPFKVVRIPPAISKFQLLKGWFIGACQGGWKKVTAVFRKPPKLPGGSGVIFIGTIALGAATEARAFNYAPDSGNAPKTDNGAKELIRKIRRLP